MAVDLKAFTPARVALGRTGHSIATRELLAFELDHARARDAVYEELDPGSIPYDHILVHSQAIDRALYLRRPDLGRRLQKSSRAQLARGPYDAAIVIADGLSARAVHRHAAPLLAEVFARLEGWRLAPLVLALQGRVAIGDEIGAALGAEVVVVLIGERPGLTSPDSLGAYLTFGPRIGRTDAERNCISNIRAEGLSYTLAANTLCFLMQEARLRKLSGIALKDDSSRWLASRD